jgi:hypothetical protein
VRAAFLEELPIDSRGWEIVVALHYNRLIAFGDDLAVPDCFNHSLDLQKNNGVTALF